MTYENQKLQERVLKKNATEIVYNNSTPLVVVKEDNGETVQIQISDSNDMSGFTQLNKLEISYADKRIRNISTLKEVEISGEKCNAILKDLAGNSNLTALHIKGAGEIDAGCIAAFKNLETLTITSKSNTPPAQSCSIIQRNRGIPTHPQSRIPNQPVENYRADVVNADALQCLTKLKNLLITGNTNVDSMNFINKLSNLEVLDLNALELDKLPDLKGLNNLKKLRVGQGTIESLEELCNAPKLEAININDNRVSDITPLSKLEQLEVVYLNNNLIKDLSPLSSLKKLYYVSIERNYIENISPLSTVKSLEVIHSSGNPCYDYSSLLELPVLIGGNFLDGIKSPKQHDDFREAFALRGVRIY